MKLNEPITLGKRRAVYPSKTTLNLAMKEKSQFHPKRLVPLLVLLLAAAALFGKFAVADRIAAVYQAQAELSALNAQISDLQRATADFNDVSDQYRRYSVGWMTGEEQAMVDRVELLDLLEEELMSAGGVLGLTGSGNLLAVQLTGVTLDDTSRIVERLYGRDDVENVQVYSATTGEKTGDSATVSLIITMTAKGGERK